MKASCYNCAMRQPTLESAGNFNPANPDHFECAVESEFFPDAADICQDYVPAENFKI